MRPDWLQDMPPAWKQVPFGSIFTQSKRKNTLLERDFVLSVVKDRGVVPYTEKGNVGNKVSDDLSGYKLVDRGDFVLNSMNLFMGSVGVSDYDGVTSTAYIVCKPSQNIHAPFYHYLIQFKGFQEYVGFLGKGIMEIREAVRWTALKSVFVPVPDLATQKAIAKFLDRETARIDQLIEKKQKFINGQEIRLQSKLQELVLGGASVRRGLGGNWLQDLPNDWRLMPLKHLVSVVGGATPSKDREDYWIGAIPWVSPKDMKLDVIYDVPDHVSEAALSGSAIQMIPEEAVLVVVRGMILARTVPVCRLGAPATINQDMKALLPRKRLIRGDYLQRMLQGFGDILMSFIEEAAHGTKKLRSDALFGLKFPVPPLEVQRNITDEYERSRVWSEKVNHLTFSSIERLREFRSTLVTAAITGQIDVATWGKQGKTDRRLDLIEEEMSRQEASA